MFRTLSPVRSAVGFYLLTLFGSFASALTGAGTQLAMLIPTFVTVLMLVVLTREGWTRSGWASLGLHRAGLRYWPVAVGIPVVITACGAIGVVSTGFAAWQRSGNALLAPWLWPALFALHLVVAGVTVCLGEEIGWRGYFLPRLGAIGQRQALLLSGLLHGVWHLPYILLTGLYHPAGSRLVVVPMFLVTLTAVGVFLGWLRLRSDSVWPVVIGHAANNVAIMWLGSLIVGDAVAIQYLADEGAVAMVLYLVVAAVLLVRTEPVRAHTPAGVAEEPAVV